MKRIAHRVVNAADVVGDVVVQMPDIGCRHRDVFRKAAIPIHADDPRERTDVCIAGPAQQTPAVDDVPLGGHTVAFFDVCHEAAYLHDVTSELMTHDERRLAPALRPRVPFVDVDISAAHACTPYANQHFVFADSRLRDILQLETRRRGFFYQRFHVHVLRRLRVC